ncbi:MAG: TetR/AcrR family transcriptional regulator [Alphaproteobacteria bacterium]|nr:TetR/AcrR family transcriptional regulator [Alphaproteobacteria bacterium]
MARAPRGTPKDPERAREAILDAAAHRFSQHGYRGTRVADVARDAGYSEALVYFHFTSKADLFRDVMGRLERENAPESRVLTPSELVARLRDAERRYHQDARWRARDAAWVEALAGDPSLLEMLRPELGATLDALERALARFDLRDDEARRHRMATMLLAVAYGTRVLRRYHVDTLSVSEAVELLGFATQAALQDLGVPVSDSTPDRVGDPTDSPHRVPNRADDALLSRDSA